MNPRRVEQSTRQFLLRISLNVLSVQMSTCMMRACTALL